MHFTIPLCTLEGSCQLELNTKERIGLPTYIKRTNSFVRSRTAQYKQRRALYCIVTYVFLTTWTVEKLIMIAHVQYKGKGCCFKTEQWHETQDLHDERKARLLCQKLKWQECNLWRNTFYSVIAHHFQLKQYWVTVSGLMFDIGLWRTSDITNQHHVTLLQLALGI